MEKEIFKDILAAWASGSCLVTAESLQHVATPEDAAIGHEFLQLAYKEGLLAGHWHFRPDGTVSGIMNGTISAHGRDVLASL